MAPIATAASTATPCWPITMLSQGIFSIMDISDTASQSDLTQKNQKFQSLLEENRRTFHWETFEKIAELQREIARVNHNLRLTGQKRVFENRMRQIGFQHFLQNWPLMMDPFDMREEIVLPHFSFGQPRAGLRVILTRSADPFYNQYIHPFLEDSLCEFLNKHYSPAGKYPVFFYRAGWKDPVGGDAEVKSVLHAALKNLPALIITPKLTNHLLYLTIAVWGLGVDTEARESLFVIPFEPSNGKNGGKEDDYRRFAGILQLYINYTAGWIADTYYMIEYDQMPLLPGIILHHPDQPKDGSFLKDYFTRQYKDSYDYIYGGQPILLNGREVSIRDTKVFDIPALCLNYSHGASDLIKESSAAFAEECIRDSMWNWLTLRGMNREMKGGPELLSDVCKAATYYDIPYLNALKQSYVTLPNSGEPGVAVTIHSLNQRIAWLK